MAGVQQRTASVAAAVLDWAARTPDKTCLVFEDRRYSYAHFAALATEWAAALQRWGLRPGDRVALYLENSPSFLAAYLGIHLAGGTVVLVNTQYRQVELRHILGDSGARLCLTDAAGSRELDRVHHELPDLQHVVLAEDASSFLAGAHAAPPAPPNPHDVAVIAYTSGT